MLGSTCERSSTDGTLVVQFLGARLCVVLLLSFVVPALKRAEVNAAGIQEALDEVLHLLLMAWFSGANEIIICESEHLQNALELSRIFIRERLWGDALGGRALFYFYAVLISAREEEDILTTQAHGACPDITDRSGIGVTDVRPVVDVIDGSGDVSGHERCGW